MNPDKIRYILNSLFLILALATVIVYIAGKYANFDFKVTLYVGGAALFLKMMEIFIRFTNK